MIVLFVLSCYILEDFTSISFNLWYLLIWWNFPFTILAPIPKLIQVFLSQFYSGSNPFVMLIGCTGINFQQIISSCLNKISRITEFLVHVISRWSERSFPPSVCCICGLPSLPAHTCSSLPQHTPHSASDRPLPPTLGSDLLQLTFGCQRVNSWAPLLQVMWQMIRSRTVFWLSKVTGKKTLKLFSNFCVKVKIQTVIKFPGFPKNYPQNTFAFPVQSFTNVWCHVKAVFFSTFCFIGHFDLDFVADYKKYW